MTSPTDAARPIIRTTETTANRIRALAGGMSNRLAGRRITHDRLIVALCDLADQEPDKLFRILEELHGGQ